MSDQIRNPKSEIRSKRQTQNSNSPDDVAKAMSLVLKFGDVDIVINSLLGIRHSLL
ncbi:MAG TPA: hypothetical protein VJ721_03275 [Chthoniobacterales bacterium]|nr:hypothetical protein [Chthoniobacterales bacterium]